MPTIDYYRDFLDDEYGYLQTHYQAALADYAASPDAGDLVFRSQSLQRPAWLAWRREALINRLRGTSGVWGRRGADRLERASRRLLVRAPPGKAFHSQVGQYVIRDGMGKRGGAGFLIDADDHPEVMSPALLEWGQVYFKSNLWSGRREYPAKVRPIVRGGPRVPGNQARLLGLRRQAKEWDFVFIYNVWGGREHNLRLYEALSKVPGRKIMKAIIRPGRGADGERETRRLVARLEKAGVDWSLTPLPVEEYWQLCAASRLVIGRVGKYMSIPYSVTEFLAMGACFTLDHDPYPQWPVPLRHGQNYLSLGIRRPEDTSPGPDEDYERLAGRVAAYLRDEDLQAQIRCNNEAYYEAHASPLAVGRYIVETLKASGVSGDGGA
jgi:hypothetical protein